MYDFGLVHFLHGECLIVPLVLDFPDFAKASLPNRIKDVEVSFAYFWSCVFDDFGLLVFLFSDFM